MRKLIGCIAMGFLCTVPIGASAQPVVYSAGYALGSDEALIASSLLKMAAKNIEGVTVDYFPETNGSYANVKDRFSETSRLTDIAFAYAGMTEQLDEISALRRKGLIHPIDTLPGFSALPIRNIYPNLLEPVLADGHLWAIPIRVSPPILFSRRDINLSPRAFQSWPSIVEASTDNPFVSSRSWDGYFLWLSMLGAENASILSPNGYLQYTPLHGCAFDQARSLNSFVKKRGWDGAHMGLVVPNDIFNNPFLRTEVNFFSFPGDEASPIYCGESSWFLVVSAHLVGEKKDRIVDLLRTALSEEIQLAIARQSFSPPIVESITNSPIFAEMFDETTPQFHFSRAMPRLTFRPSGQSFLEAETKMQAEFENLLRLAPLYEDRFNDIVQELNTSYFAK